jgi:hypothetical protein
VKYSKELLKQLSQSLRLKKQLYLRLSNQYCQLLYLCSHSIHLNHVNTLETPPTYITEILSHILELFISIFESLKLQVGTEFIQQTVSSFLPLLSIDKLTVILDSKGSNAIVKLLQIFTIIFEDPTSTFDRFIAPVYKLVTEQIFPHAKDLEIKLSVYKLFYTLLLQKSKHFYADLNLYLSVIQMFIESLSNPDINICKQNLSLLDSLNEKQRLYTNLSRTPCYGPLLNTLFSVLFNKMHNILIEDITATIYKVASADFRFFYSTVLFLKCLTNFVTVFGKLSSRVSITSKELVTTNISRRTRSSHLY